MAYEQAEKKILYDKEERAQGALSLLDKYFFSSLLYKVFNKNS
jgi:hypothetical protein